MKRKKRKVNGFLVLGSWFLVLSLMGCAREALYNNLSQEDANKVMVLLQQNGIQAKLDKEVIQNETFWKISVNQEDLARARELVVTSQVISPRAPGLKEVYQGKGAGGWIRTPAEERARYLLALKGEIVNSLKKLPEVVDADVVLNVPEQDELGLKEKKHPTASVVLKSKTPEQGASTLSEIQIQQFVANSVEGMSARDVSVLLHFLTPVGKSLRPGQTVLLPPGREASQQPKESESYVRLMGLKLDPNSKDRLKVYLIVFFLVLILLSAALILSIVQSGRTRQELKSLRGVAPALEGRKEGEGLPPRLGAPEREEENLPPEG